MTRKRFVKLLMANGYSRNEAQAMAWNAVQKGRSYADVYRAANSVAKLANTVWLELNEALRAATDAITWFARAIFAGMSAFSEAFNKSMSTEGDHERNTYDQAAAGVVCLPQDGDREPAGAPDPIAE